MINKFGIIEDWEENVLVDRRGLAKAKVFIAEHEGLFYFGIDVDAGPSGWSFAPGPKWMEGFLTYNDALRAGKKYIMSLALRAMQEDPRKKPYLDVVVSSCEPKSGYLFQINKP